MLNLSYEAVDEAVLDSDAVASAAELHGVLAGMLCVDPGLDCGQWLLRVFGESQDGLDDGGLSILRELYGVTRGLLGAVDFSFQLLLPDDDVALAERVSALSGWCQGFLYGIGSSGPGADWSGDSGEVLRDLADISRLDANVSGEEDEVAYAEVSEFVRVGVQIIRGEMQASPLSNRHLH